MIIKIKCSGTAELSIDTLIEFQGELKSLAKEDYEKLKKEILELGFCEPINIWREKRLIANGHQRLRTLKAMRKEGYEIPDIPCSFVFPDDEKDFARIVLSLTSQYGKIEKQGLYEYMHKHNIDIGYLEDSFRFPEINFDDFKIEFFEDDKYGDKDADAVPEARKTEIKLGDLFQLGNHRLLCSDSTIKENVEILMAGQKADMVYTDPPYGMNLETDRRGMGNTTTNYAPIVGDSEKFDPSHILKISAKTYWLWGADYYADQLPEGGSWIVWAKAHSEEENKVWGSSFEICWTLPKRKKEIWFERRIHMSDEHIAAHPTQKPIGTITRALHLEPDAHNIVDLYLGSGSTLIACQKTSRRCFACEIDPHYVSVVIRRWMAFTGEMAYRLNEDGSQTAYSEIDPEDS